MKKDTGNKNTISQNISDAKLYLLKNGIKRSHCTSTSHNVKIQHRKERIGTQKTTTESKKSFLRKVIKMSFKNTKYVFRLLLLRSSKVNNFLSLI